MCELVGWPLEREEGGDDERAAEREADGELLRHEHHDGEEEREGDEDEEDAGGQEEAEVHERLPRGEPARRALEAPGHALAHPATNCTPPGVRSQGSGTGRSGGERGSDLRVGRRGDGCLHAEGAGDGVVGGADGRLDVEGERGGGGGGVGAFGGVRVPVGEEGRLRLGRRGGGAGGAAREPGLRRLLHRG